jgi:hypothetical protein
MVRRQHSNQLNYVPTAFNYLPQDADSTVHPIRMCLQIQPDISRIPAHMDSKAILPILSLHERPQTETLSPFRKSNCTKERPPKIPQPLQVQRVRVKKLLMNDLVCMGLDLLQQENRLSVGPLGRQRSSRTERETAVIPTWQIPYRSMMRIWM